MTYRPNPDADAKTYEPIKLDSISKEFRAIVNDNYGDYAFEEHIHN
jgi:hypothetical protein